MTVIEMVRMLGGGEFDKLTDEQIEVWDKFVTPFVSKKQFGDLYDHAKALLICHKMAMTGLGENSLGELGKVKNSFAASSVSDGGSSISFASSGPGNLSKNAELAMTIYGLQYLQLIQTRIMPIRVSGEDDLRARI